MRVLPSRKHKRKWLWLALTPVAAFLVAARVMNTSPPTNRSLTTPDTPDAALRTRVYNLPLEGVETAARQVVRSLTTYRGSWSIVYTGRADDTARQRTLDVEVPVLFFTDDMTIAMVSEGDNKTRVNVASQSRVGKGDFGENRRHIVQLLSALDEKIK